MSTSGQGDQISETNKDDDPEISITTSENEGLKETVRKSNENSPAAAVDPEDTETSKAVKTVASDLPSSSLDQKPVIDAVPTAAEIQESLDIMLEGSELRVETGCDVGSTEVSPPKSVVSKIYPEAGSSDVTRDTGLGSPKSGVLKDIPELNQAETDKDSSIEEVIELRWDEDDDAEEATEPTHTDYVLEMLNKELGEDCMDALKKETIKSVKDTKSDINKIKDVIKAMTANESFEESQKILAEIDSLTQEGEMDKTTELSTECENPVTVDESVNNFEDNETPKNEVELEKTDIEESKLQTAAIEVSIKPLPKNDEVMNVDNTKDIIKKEPIKVTISTNYSFEKSKKNIAEICSFTQDDEINKTTKLPTESDKPITLAEADKQFENVEMPMDEVDSEKLEFEKSKIETVSREIPLKPLNKDDKKMDVDDSEDITQENKIKEENNTYNETAKVPTVAVDELDKQLDYVEIPKNEVHTEELITKTVSIEIPFNPLTKDDEKVNVDKSGENKKENEIVKVATRPSVSFEACQKTIAENDSLTQDDKMEKTPELPSESKDSVTVGKSDIQLDDVEILKNVLDESEKPDIEDSKPETKAIEVPLKLLSKGDGVMDLDNSNDIDKDTSTVDDFTAENTSTQVNTLDSVQKEKVETIKYKEVLDNIEDKKDSSNISHDIRAEVLKPAETVTSKYDIPSTDKTILQENPMIPVKDEHKKTKTIENISEISQPVDDKNKKSDANALIQDVDDKLSTVESIDNKSNDGQEIDDTALKVQDNRKSSDEPNTALKSSESQAVDDRVSSTKDLHGKTLEAESIPVNTETADKLGENASILDDSLIDTTISPNKHHRINKPNVMLDIPTQDFSDIEGELSDSEINEDIEKSGESTENIKKSTEIDEPSESHKIVNVIAEISEITTPTIEIDATTSKLNITTVSPFKLNRASSKDGKIDDESTKMQDILTKNDDKNVAEKSSHEVEKSDDDKPSSSRQVDDQQLSSSKDLVDDKLEKLTSDDADEVQESDSLGLLAESSRVMDDIDDDDEEPEELEPDDNDDDEDFDPYDG